MFKGQENNFVKKTQKLGQIGEMSEEILRDELVQAMLWRNDKLKCSTSELRTSQN